MRSECNLLRLPFLHKATLRKHDSFCPIFVYCYLKRVTKLSPCFARVLPVFCLRLVRVLAEFSPSFPRLFLRWSMIDKNSLSFSGSSRLYFRK